MLILLPPSEGKAAPRRGRPLDLASMSFPGLHGHRAVVLDALRALCTTNQPALAAEVLGLGSTQTGEVARNARLLEAAQREEGRFLIPQPVPVPRIERHEGR